MQKKINQRGKKYKGQAGGSFEKRHKEHRLPFRNNNSNSKLGHHLQAIGHSFGKISLWYYGNFAFC
jgi:hypothetical protein